MLHRVLASLRRCGAEYERLNTERPVLTKSVVGFGLFGLGDVIGQGIERRRGGADNPSSVAASPPSTSPILAVVDAATGASAPCAAAAGTTHNTVTKDTRITDATSANPAAAVAAAAPRSEAAPHDWTRTLRMASWRALIFTAPAHVFYVVINRLIPGTSIAVVAARVATDQLIWTPPIFTSYLAWDAYWKGDDVAQNISNRLWPTMQMGWKMWPLAHSLTFSVVPVRHRVLFVNCVSLVWSVVLSRMGGTPVVVEAEPAHMHADAAGYDHGRRGVVQ